MDESGILVHIKAVEPSTDSQSWQVDITSGGHHVSAKITNPFSKKDEARVAWYLEKYWLEDPFAVTKASEASTSIERYGQQLYKELETSLKACGVDVSSKNVGLTVSGFGEDYSIHRLHWEALEHPSLGKSISVQRVFNGKAGREGRTKTANLLFITSRLVEDEETDDFIDHRIMLAPLIELISNLPADYGFHFDVVRPGTFEALGRFLKAKDYGFYDIVHFDVHGRVRKGQSLLRFVSQDNFSKYNDVPADVVGQILCENGVDTALLNACNSAAADSGTNGNLAIGLLKAGLSSVIGMSYKILHLAAQLFMRQLYEAFFVQKMPLSTAVHVARTALYQNRNRAARFQLSVQIDDWIVPVLYQSKRLARADLVRCSSLQTNIEFSGSESAQPDLSGDIDQQVSSASKLIGRNHNMFVLENKLLASPNMLEVQGQIGVGKTAVLEELATWWRTTKLVDVVVWWDFAQYLPKTAQDVLKCSIIRESTVTQLAPQTSFPEFLKHELGVLDSSSIIDAIRFLSSRRVLLIVDHLEDAAQFLKGDEAAEFESFLQELYEIAINSQNCFLIMATTLTTNITKLPILSLNPLRSDYALDLAMKKSPRFQKLHRESTEARQYASRLLRSLGYNPLAILIHFEIFEASKYQSIQDLLNATWLGRLSSRIEGLRSIRHPGMVRIERAIADLLTSKEELQVLSSLLLFREVLPKDISPLLKSFNESGVFGNARAKSRKHRAGGKIGPAELAEYEKAFQDVSTVLQLVGLITDDGGDVWSLHPLMPFMLQYCFPNVSQIDKEILSGLFSSFYEDRFFDLDIVDINEGQNERQNDGQNEGIDGVAEIQNATQSEDHNGDPNGYQAGEGKATKLEVFEIEFANFITSFWLSMELVRKDHSRLLPMPAFSWICVKHLIYDDPSQKSNGNFHISEKLCLDAASLVDELVPYWKSVAFKRKAGRWIRFRRSEMHYLLEHATRGWCECGPLDWGLDLYQALLSYHLTRTVDVSVLSMHLARCLKQWHVLERTFGDSFHRNMQERKGKGTYLMICAGTVAYIKKNLDEAEAYFKMALSFVGSTSENQMNVGLCNLYLKHVATLKQSPGNSDTYESSKTFDREIIQLLSEHKEQDPQTNYTLGALFAASQWADSPETVHETHPEIAIALDNRHYISGKDDERMLRIGRRDALLQDFEMLVSKDGPFTFQGQIATYHSLAQEAMDREDWNSAIYQYDQSLALLDREKFPGNSTGKSDVRSSVLLLREIAALEAGKIEQAIWSFQSAYTLLKSGPLSDIGRLNLFYALSQFIGLESRTKESLGYNHTSIYIELLSLIYDPKTFGSDHHQNVVYAYENCFPEWQNWYAKMKSGIFLEELFTEYMIEKRGDKWKLSKTPQGKQVLKELKNTIGAWSLSLESFLEGELISALPRAVIALYDEGVVDGNVAYDDLSEELQEMIQARRYEVFAEAEKVLFAPDEERKNFKWLGKKYEKSGLRKKWT